MRDRWNRIRFLVVLPIFFCATALYGQSPSATGRECTYDRCALRIEDGKILRGAVGERVGKLGGWGGGMDVLMVGPDSASHYARLFTKTRRRGLAIGLPGALVFAAAQLLDRPTWWDGSDTAYWLGAAAAPLVLYSVDVGYTYDRVAVRAAHRSVWWYNRQFADEGSPASAMQSLWPERNAPGRLILGGGALGAALAYAAGDNAEGAFIGSTLGSMAGFLVNMLLSRW